jgi:hypothetical protein
VVYFKTAPPAIAYGWLYLTSRLGGDVVQHAGGDTFSFASSLKGQFWPAASDTQITLSDGFSPSIDGPS